MPDSSQDDQIFNDAFSAMDDQHTPLDSRVEHVLDIVEDTTVTPEEVLIAYGAYLRKEDPLDNNQRRVSSLITTAERYDIDVSTDSIIDATLSGDTGPKTSTTVSTETDDAVNINDRSELRKAAQESKNDIPTFDIDFNSHESVITCAVNIYDDDSLGLDEKRDQLKSLLNQARRNGLDVDPSDVRSAIRDAHEQGNDIDQDAVPTDTDTTVSADNTDDIKPSKSASIDVSNVSLSSTGIRAGDTIDITVEIKNTGDNSGVKELTISKDHEIVKKETVTVEAQDTATKRFTLQLLDGGQHLIQVNNETSTTVTVLDAADISIVDLTADSTQLAPDTATTLHVEAENTGDVRGSYTIELEVDGTVRETRTINVDGNTSVEEPFDIEFQQPGDYMVTVADKTLEFTALKPASVNVTDYRLSSTGLQLDEELTVTADIENTGDLDGTIAVALYANGNAVETNEIHIDGKSTTTTAFDTVFDRTGSHAIRINNHDETEVTVLKPASTSLRSFNIQDNELEPDGELHAVAGVDNTGDLSDEITLNISTDSQVIHTEDVEVPGNQSHDLTIGPGDDIDIQFSEFIQDPGKHTISINDLPSKSFTVLSTPEVNVRYYSLSTNETDPGEDFDIEVTVENTGDVPGETSVDIFIGDKKIDTKQVEVDGNSDKMGTFSYSLSDPGEYSVRINNLEPSDLTVRGTGRIEVTDASIIDRETPYEVGDEFTVEITATNPTSLSAQKDFTMYLGGMELSKTPLQLDGNTEETQTITQTVEQAGVYDIELDSIYLGELEIFHPLNVVSLSNPDYRKVIDQCVKITADGTRCTRDIEDDELFCWQHDDSIDSLDPREVEQCAYIHDDETPCPNTSEPGGLLCVEHNPLGETFDRQPLTDQESDSEDAETDTDSDNLTPAVTRISDTGDSETESPSEPEPATAGQTELTPEETPSESEPATEPSTAEMAAELQKATDPDEGHKRTRSPTGEVMQEDGLLNDGANTQSLVSFDFVLGDDEDFLPNGVDGSGIIVDGDEYVGLAEVQPRSWSIHTPEEKQNIINQYRSMFLSSIDFPVQIVCYPTEFDISEHIKALEERTDRTQTRDDESYLLNVGRSIYPNWLREFISRNNMKQRNFFIAVRVKPEQLNRFRQNDGSLLDTIEQRAPAIANLLRKVVPGSGEEGVEDVTRKDCIVELHDRLQRIESSLNPMGVSVEPIYSRDRTMTVLYQYYNNEHPVVDSFGVATRSKYDPTMHIDDDGWETDGMTDIHYEEYNLEEQ